MYSKHETDDFDKGGYMKCLNCGKRVIELGLKLADGSYCLKPGSSLIVDYDEIDEFVSCPYCKAKNVLHALESDRGPDKLFFHHFKLD